MKKLSRPFGNLKLRGNIYWALCLYIGLIMLLYTMCRLGFYLFNPSYFPAINAAGFVTIFLGGLRFDLTAMLYTNVIFILLLIVPFKLRFNRYYLSTAKWVFYTINAVALLANVSDFIYFRFTLRRTTFDVFQQFMNEQNLIQLILRFTVDYWYAVLFWMLLVVLMVWLYKKITITGPMVASNILFYSGGVLAMLITAILFVGGVRGDFKHSTRPITLNDAGNYVQNPQQINLVLNTPFAILRTINNSQIKKVAYFNSPQQLDAQFNPVQHIVSDSLQIRKENVVVIILESFSKEFFGFYNKDKEGGHYKGYTPFLDSLIQNSKTFRYSFANGRKSIDGIPSVTASIPSLGVPYIVTPYSGNRINSIASLLKPEGYHTSFFHGAPNGSMGFLAFTNIAGFEHYYGKTEYNNDADFDGWWGIWDEKFFNFYADKLNTFPQPFASAIFSVSSHHPFILPEEYKDKFKGGTEPILKCIEYTDYSLKKFFNKASKMPWFKNTLFVITADHTSSNILFEDGRTASGLYSIPIIFYKPDNSLKSIDEKITQQIDILPSILGHIHYNKDFVAFGKDVFNKNSEDYAFNYKDNVYQLFKGDYLLAFDGIKSVSLYNFKTDKESTHNLINEKTEIAEEMQNKMKAIIQQYNNRMVDNKFTTESVK